jgi:lantibiotic leader peptide-processing serine protease
MIRKNLVLGLSTLAMAGCGGAGSGAEASLAARSQALETLTVNSVREARRSRYVTVFKGDTTSPELMERVERAGGQLSLRMDAIGVVTVTADEEFVRRMRLDPDVLAVGPEFFDELPETTQVALSEADGALLAEGAEGAAEGASLAPSAADDLYFYHWNLRRIGAPAAWGRIPLEAQRQVTVAVLDTGVMDDHPDLVGQVVDSVATNYCQEKGGAFGSAAYPIYRTFIDFDAHPRWHPSYGCGVDSSDRFENHGTHVAGTIAARVGGGRVVGVAPGVRIAAYKVFDRYRYTSAQGVLLDRIGAFTGPQLAAIIDAADKGYDVISMSLGGLYDRSNRDHIAAWLARDRVVRYAHRKGSLVIAAAGNSGLNSNGSWVHLPSDLPSVISVAASNSDDIRSVGGLFEAAPGSDTFASYSNHGASTDLAAPGGDCGPAGCLAQYFILSSIIRPDGSAWYGFLAGTSMATPHVSAVAALIRAQHPGWAPDQVRKHLRATADDVGSRMLFGHGVLNADAATR